jgi:hypothetical protein
MTDVEWQSSQDGIELVKAALWPQSRRKQRLLSVAFARRIDAANLKESWADAIGIAECFADDESYMQELVAAHQKLLEQPKTGYGEHGVDWSSKQARRHYRTIQAIISACDLLNRPDFVAQHAAVAVSGDGLVPALSVNFSRSGGQE